MLMIPAINLYRELGRNEDHPGAIGATAPVEDGEITTRFIFVSVKAAMLHAMNGKPVYTTVIHDGDLPTGGSGLVYTEDNPPSIGAIKKRASRFIEAQLGFYINHDETHDKNGYHGNPSVLAD